MRPRCLFSLRADSKAERLLREAAERLRTIRSLQADATLTISMELPDGVQKIEGKGKVALERPNFSRVELTGGVGKVYVSDGVRSWRQFPRENVYQEDPADPEGGNAVALPLHAAAFFFRTADLWPGPKGAELRYVGSERFDGVVCDVVERLQMEGKMSETFFLGPDRTLRRVVMRMSLGRPQIIDSRLHRIRLNPRIAPSAFVFKPDPGAKPFVKPNGAGKLLAVGSAAPEFVLPSLSGGNISLAGVRAGKRAVLVNFWYYNCGPCQAEMPTFQKLYAALRPQGFELIAVDNFDQPELLRKYRAKNGFTFPIALGKDETFRTYQVENYPTNYLIDPEGKILWRGIGYDASGEALGLKGALEKLGFAISLGIFEPRKP